LFSPFLQLLLLSNVEHFAAEKMKTKDHDFMYWTFQEAFCQHAPSPTDIRYNIHGFAILHGKLYIVVELDHPPFAATRANIFFDFSNQLPNNFVRTYRTIGYSYAIWGLNLGECLLPKFPD